MEKGTSKEKSSLFAASSGHLEEKWSVTISSDELKADQVKSYTDITP